MDFIPWHKTVCRFCRKTVLVYDVNGRIYEFDKKTFHVDRCPRRKAAYKRRAAEYADRRRQRRYDKDESGTYGYGQRLDDAFEFLRGRPGTGDD